VQFEFESYLEEFVASRISEEDRRAQVVGALKVALEPTHEVGNLGDLLELGQFVQSQVPTYREWITADTAGLVVRIATEQPAIWDRIHDYAKRYGWMGRMYFAGSPISAADVVLRLQTVLQNDCAEKLANVAIRREEQLAERQRAIETLDDSKAKLLADVLASYMHLRSERLDVFFIAHEHVLDVLGVAARTLGLRRTDDILYLDWREISNALRDGADAEDLQTKAIARRDGFEFIAISGATEWIAPPVDAHDHPVVQASKAETDILTGVTACGGHIQGMARLVLSDQHMLDMVAGEILVTTMTTPSLMLAVEKAAGIVTDEGGMLCHAAIVSREFNIPCVIGTNEATQRIRTGDTIDLAADEGKVQVVVA
jgi:pyruvate,water dikinase